MSLETRVDDDDVVMVVMMVIILVERTRGLLLYCVTGPNSHKCSAVPDAVFIVYSLSLV